MLPALSILNSTRPALTSRTAFAVSSVTEPEGEVNGFVELGLRKLGQHFHGGLERIRFRPVHQFQSFFITFTWHNYERCKRAIGSPALRFIEFRCPCCERCRR